MARIRSASWVDDPGPPTVGPPNVNCAEAVRELHRAAVPGGQLERVVAGRVGQLDTTAASHRSPPSGRAASCRRLAPTGCAALPVAAGIVRPRKRRPVW